METEPSLEYRFVLSPDDFSGVYSKQRDENRLAGLRRLSYCLLIGIPLVLATNVLDRSGALAGLAGLVGMMTIVAGIMANLRLIFSRKEKAAQFDPRPTLVRVNQAGISKLVTDSESHTGWSAVEKITLTEFGIGLITQQDAWLIPKKAFGTENEMRVQYDNIVSVMNSSQIVQTAEQTEPRTLH
ncbi:hypothetical protein FJV76_05660 [Mesorhizobium sp. WSM4303]|uniref:hypothetical protein n=1 Tax=unclassified Mesorhizobium TaxID=325217 RepID=UPI00115F34BC|nr:MULTISPECIES: hypothetical protein [unclassified Mesorhizobium]TRC94349.1 hypothetical protein FJV77_19585 [Mesorhizobium sp. WSM4306]TRD07330.1 hypothetical protein FJV76_05660 [Mesorhizobium sp. WSM4303]